MKKKTIILLILTVLTIISIRACYLSDYETVLKYAKPDSRLYISPDSITIAPYLYVENSITIGAVIDFESLSDSLLLTNLHVSVRSIDHPKQSFQLKNVS